MPATVWRYTTRRVLITEWVDGASPSQLLAKAEVALGADASEEERQRRRAARRRVLSLVRMGVQCSLAQVRAWGGDVKASGCTVDVAAHAPAARPQRWPRPGPRPCACCPQLLVTGVMHGDPHSGNLLLRRADGRLCYLDFGLVVSVGAACVQGPGCTAVWGTAPAAPAESPGPAIPPNPARCA